MGVCHLHLLSDNYIRPSGLDCLRHLKLIESIGKKKYQPVVDHPRRPRENSRRSSLLSHSVTEISPNIQTAMHLVSAAFAMLGVGRKRHAKIALCLRPSHHHAFSISPSNANWTSLSLSARSSLLLVTCWLSLFLFPLLPPELMSPLRALPS
jgi:hypothetical protein